MHQPRDAVWASSRGPNKTAITTCWGGLRKGGQGRYSQQYIASMGILLHTSQALRDPRWRQLTQRPC
eukprot:scaffold60778_cov29-Tisochrysis_lutea.AAC.2